MKCGERKAGWQKRYKEWGSGQKEGRRDGGVKPNKTETVGRKEGETWEIGERGRMKVRERE